MNHKDKLLMLLAEFGITPEVETDERGTSVTLLAKEGNVKGYTGFVCDFNFTPAGWFDSVGIWE